ncbi:hypothetical protein HS088_TW16G00518 [Tripterygium wilfordii]|uniref:Uncharacterized protein n=1 Tax=Tripterygium wilfordii TaxID=458696 RepID=A0A7J7CJ97_TRIWF|nr:hypothetical protein HS088_TW16G00518 [Tripterygium wilfordii]
MKTNSIRILIQYHMMREKKKKKKKRRTSSMVQRVWTSWDKSLFDSVLPVNLTPGELVPVVVVVMMVMVLVTVVEKLFEINFASQESPIAQQITLMRELTVVDATTTSTAY